MMPTKAITQDIYNVLNFRTFTNIKTIEQKLYYHKKQTIRKILNKLTEEKQVIKKGNKIFFYKLI